MLKHIGKIFSMLGRERNACKSGDHNFYCAEIKGDAGEIILYKRRLLPDQISRILAQPELGASLCPAGEVICRRCHKALGSSPSGSVDKLMQGKIHPRKPLSQSN